VVRPRLIRRLALVAVAVVAAAQLVPVPRANPPVETDVPASAEVREVLKRACYDCHSNETVWPWYARVAPASWLVAWDVNEGREHLNFSTWNRLNEADRQHAFEEIQDEVESGAMPLPIYLPLHPEARLSDQDKAILAAWVRESTAR
jgi:uncharacterized membrane protein